MVRKNNFPSKRVSGSKALAILAVAGGILGVGGVIAGVMVSQTSTEQRSDAAGFPSARPPRSTPISVPTSLRERSNTQTAPDASDLPFLATHLITTPAISMGFDNIVLDLRNGSNASRITLAKLSNFEGTSSPVKFEGDGVRNYRVDVQMENNRGRKIVLMFYFARPGEDFSILTPWELTKVVADVPAEIEERFTGASGYSLATAENLSPLFSAAYGNMLRAPEVKKNASGSAILDSTRVTKATPVIGRKLVQWNGAYTSSNAKYGSLTIPRFSVAGNFTGYIVIGQLEKAPGFGGEETPVLE